MHEFLTDRKVGQNNTQPPPNRRRKEISRTSIKFSLMRDLHGCGWPNTASVLRCSCGRWLRREPEILAAETRPPNRIDCISLCRLASLSLSLYIISILSLLSLLSLFSLLSLYCLIFFFISFFSFFHCFLWFVLFVFVLSFVLSFRVFVFLFFLSLSLSLCLSLYLPLPFPALSSFGQRHTGGQDGLRDFRKGKTYYRTYPSRSLFGGAQGNDRVLPKRVGKHIIGGGGGSKDVLGRGLMVCFPLPEFCFLRIFWNFSILHRPHRNKFQMKILGLFLAFAVVIERQMNSPRFLSHLLS